MLVSSSYNHGGWPLWRALVLLVQLCLARPRPDLLKVVNRQSIKARRTEETMIRVVGIAILLGSLVTFAFAGTTAPEIDAASGVAALGLLSGGLLVLRSRRKKS